jgi:hypothetical protein
MAALDSHEDLLEVILLEDTNKGILYKLCVTEFRDVKYFSIRQWYMGFEGEWEPSNNGFTMPYTLDSTKATFDALVLLLSKAEVLDSIYKGDK